MSNPFDAAIVLLREFLGVRTLNGVPFDGASLVAALNVLEAAGGVDKEDREIVIHWMEDDYSTVCALLNALPDKEKK